MEAQTWTVIGLLAATLFGALIYIGGRIDGLSSEMNSRFDGLSGRIDGLSSEMNSRFDGLSGRIDGLSSRIDGLSSEVREQGSRIEEHLRWHAN